MQKDMLLKQVGLTIQAINSLSEKITNSQNIEQLTFRSPLTNHENTEQSTSRSPPNTRSLKIRNNQI